jgi:hypothetical protein
MMPNVRGGFDKLFFTESIFGQAHFDGSQLRIPAQGLLLLGGHPLEANGYGPYEGELIFDGVASSRRTITEYIGDPRKPTGFKPPLDVVDEIPTSDTQAEELQEFGFEGRQESPYAWIDNWVVRAKSFVLKI